MVSRWSCKSSGKAFGLIWCALSAFVLPLRGREYRLGYLGRNETDNLQFHWEYNVAAMTIALEHIHDDGILAENDTISLLAVRGLFLGFATGMTGSVIESAVPTNRRGMFLRIYHWIDWLGYRASRSSDLIQTGYLAAYWNLPVLSQAAISPVLADRKTYQTLTRLVPASNKLGLAIEEILVYFGWKRFFMFSRSVSVCSYAADGVFHQMTQTGVTVTGWVQFENYPPEKDIDMILAQIKAKARIVFLCANNDDVLHFMQRAHRLNMTSSEYVYLSPAIRPFTEIAKPWLASTDESKSEIAKAYESVIQISTAHTEDEPGKTSFQTEHMKRMAGPPWYRNVTFTSIYAAPLHDSIYAYALALNKTREVHGNPRDGRQFTETLKKVTFQGMSGYVAFDENAERLPTFYLYTLKPGHNVSTSWAEVDLSAKISQKMRVHDANIWRTASGQQPHDTPSCGFFNEHCLEDKQDGFLITLGTVCPLLVITLVIILSVFIKRRRQFERDLQLMSWRIRYEELHPMAGTHLPMDPSVASLRINACKSLQSHSRRSMASSIERQVLFAKVGLYQGHVVAIKTVHSSTMAIVSRQDQLQIKAIRDLRHENINSFLGACIDPPNTCIISCYSPRGSLQDIILNSDITLDNIFKESFMLDIINGMEYLHASAVQSHGCLKSSNCVVDNRWMVKIADIDPVCLQRGYASDAGQYEIYKRMLWTAPEILRRAGLSQSISTEGIANVGSRNEDMNRSVSQGRSQKGDVYSFAIIMQEIMYRALPFFLDKLECSPKDIIHHVANVEITPYRPVCPQINDSDPAQLDLMQRCWDENPVTRPKFSQIKKVMQSLNSGRSRNIIDNILHKLEKYAEELEVLVVKRTHELVEEKKKTDFILHQLLPKSVADHLKTGHVLAPEHFDDVTVYFSDITDFVLLSAESTPLQIVNLLNEFYGVVDKLIKVYDVYKVETISDTYMVVSGLPTRNGRNHVTEIVDMALDILSSSISFRIHHQPNRKLKLRIGIHTGACVAGVLGLAMPRYCLFGDCINTASRMESHGEAFRIHISESTHSALQEITSDYVTTRRGTIEVKGKGLQTTYWLEGKVGFNKPLPDYKILDLVDT